MNDNAYKVLDRFIKLTEAEKSLFIDELNKYQRASLFEKQTLRESIRLKSIVSSKKTICTCCGR
jgi:hypothetical protein